ncbi:PX domain-containing protein EREL2-like isoform X1 [Salvia splendens]|uniref:PX domain-containing protein EREL2-like isoform X1 n=1 Tax=Salvia splendens TaxID=180675 RepID=UPI001C25B102|nr:PX domain-containing protein EREL2-like isoform X1 [Salvia splendens]XP_042007268.1 PX domain-containing protein EREL2-like isoform X1 [Salvia splendens]
MQGLSPPKHRHDGTSPLPLGMDWSPPPRIWVGRESVWPHDPRTGWSYCITIPSWIVLAKSRDLDPTVFYRVQVGIQSPEGITTTRMVLRRFNDFLKLHVALKRAFPRKSIPPTPPKGLLQMKTRAMLEARRSSLEEWMANLLSDIDLSRSIVVASFLELEAAARSSFQEEGLQSPDSYVSVTTTDLSHHMHPNSCTLAAGSSSVASDYGSDTAYEISDIGSPSLGRDNNSEVGTEDLSFYDDATSPVDKFVKYGMSNIDDGLSMGHAILEKLENFPKHKAHARENHNSEQNMSNGSFLKASHHAEDMSEHGAERSSLAHDGQKLSNESIGSDRSTLRGSESSSLVNPNGHRPFDFGSEGEVGRTSGNVGDSDYHLPDDIHLLVPVDQRQKMNRVLMTMQQRLITAKTDMEDLISRLNQEIAGKDYLATKVKDLEVELEITKQKSKGNLEQAILIERERVTQMQWDMEELRQRSMELESKLYSQQDQRPDAQPYVSPGNQPMDALCQELDSAKQQFEDLLKRHQALEVKSKADIKVLVKEVRSLRSSQSELTQQLKQSLRQKSEMEELLQEERERNEQVRSSWRKLLDRCKILQDQLQECNIDNLTHTKGDTADSLPSLLEQFDFVSTSENQIDLLIAEFEQLAEDGDNHTTSIDEESRQTLTSLLANNGALRKQVNSLIVNSLKSKVKGEMSDVNVGSEI